MAKSDPLFLLVKAMTKSEKRHFKLSTAKNSVIGGKDYLRLFDAIAAQEVYDEKAIAAKFKGEPYFSQLRSVKFYLYQQIIKSLKNIYDESSCSLKLHNYLIEIEMLYKKALFKNCAGTVKRAKAFALKYEDFPKLLELFAWESKIAIWINDIEQIESLKKKWMEEEQEVLAKYDEIYRLRQLTHEIHSFFTRKGYAKTEKEMQFMQTMLDSPLLNEKKKSFIGEVNRLSMTANCLLMLGRAEERYEILKRMVDFCDQYPHQTEERMNEYFFNLRVVTNLALNLTKFTETDRLMVKMNALYETKYNRLDFTNKMGHLNLRAGFFLRQGKFKDALDVLPEIDTLIENSREDIGQLEELYIHEIKMLVYFSNGDYKRAQHYIQKIINSGEDMRLDMQTSARIAYLIIQYEEREYQHLEYAWRSTYRYLMKKERLQQAETLVLNFLRRAKRSDTEKQVLQALAEFKELIQPYRDQFMVEFPLTEWIDSKIKNAALVDIVGRNYSDTLQKEESLSR